MDSGPQNLRPALVPIGAMLGTQMMISLAVIAIGVTMPAVARDLGVDPKLVGAFTAITYATAVVVALASARSIARFGAVRVCQFALLCGAAGLAINALGAVVATVLSVVVIGFAQGPINPASSHILSQRVPRRWFSIVFSIKQTGVPLGFAAAGLLLPWLLPSFGWRGASLIVAAAMLCGIAALEAQRTRLDATVAPPGPSPGMLSSISMVIHHRQLRALGGSALLYVVAQHTFTFYLVTFLYEHCGMDIVQAGFLLFLSQMAGTVLRLVLGGAGDRVPRLLLLGWVGIAISIGAFVTGLLSSSTPVWLVGAVVVGYGAVAISWNGVSIAEFAYLSPPGQVAAVAAVQTALAFSGAVIGPPLFGLTAAVAGYQTAFLGVALCGLVGGLLLFLTARRRT